MNTKWLKNELSNTFPLHSQSRFSVQVRYLLIGILLLVFTLNYLQRVNVSILMADPEFITALGLTGETGKQGWLMTLFLLAYAVTNILTGSLGDRFGPRRIMSLGILLGGLATALGGMATGLGTLLVVRVLLGIGQGLYYPNQGVFIRRWFPPWERGKANSLCSLGGNLGTITAMPLFALITVSWGWQMNFYLIAVVALVFILPAVWFLISDWPQESSLLGAAERSYLAKNNPNDGTVLIRQKGFMMEAVKEVFKVPQIIWFILVYISFLSIWYGLLTWLPQYLTVARGFPFKTMGFLSALPYIAGIGGLILSGFGSDRLGRRAPFALVAFISTSLLLYAAAITTNVKACVLLISLATGTLSLFIGVFWAMVQTRLPLHLVGLGTGVISGVGNLFSAFAPLFIGFLIQLTGQYLIGILYMVAFGVVGAACSWTLARTET
ncbi:MAG: MFS transporter [Syntrophomonadaceae bacterium]|jgi:sugar phosphate permease|nr:MFS transporter [Syntrophomonadaceae bacterium]